MSGPAAPIRWLFRLVGPGCVELGDGTTRVSTILGHRLYVDAHDTSLRPSLVTRGYWEAGVTSVLLRMVRPGQHVVEVGANIGWHTVLLASAVGPTGSVTAFEANPRMVEFLERNLAENGASANVRVVPLAVIDRPGRVTLHRLARQQGSSSIYPFGPADLAVWDDVASPLEVEATSLDAFFAGADATPDFVRIDAEGAEPAILAGLRGLLERTPHLQLVFEWLPSALRRAGHDPEAFLSSLEGQGFGFHTIDRRGRLLPATIARLLAADAEDIYARR